MPIRPAAGSMLAVSIHVPDELFAESRPRRGPAGNRAHGRHKAVPSLHARSAHGQCRSLTQPNPHLRKLRSSGNHLVSGRCSARLFDAELRAALSTLHASRTIRSHHDQLSRGGVVGHQRNVLRLHIDSSLEHEFRRRG